TAGGAGFTLTVNGSTFNNSSVVQWNGSARPTTTVLSGGRVVGLRASISSNDIATAGTAQVTVFTPAPGGGTSSAISFTVGTVTTEAADWIQKSPANKPTPREEPGMAHDATRRQVVMFGGFNDGGLNDTWVWDGTNW